ncbi:MAG: hypothetical protein HN353_06265 [Bdellovibrionales bacterium]|jgi:hypothetical protein|nr:hypothetical protein [Bdellovibrionales bacterium]MBT3526237.1 hypothetical protein [Bdellovibrionales bacterium]MBT7670563.1 hypothetical protein [Bdellovibrionales bacterium]MBT7766432.1 hypothetical protein [Bdellovibrionales bacterium]
MGDKDDFTRIENISDFLHDESSETDGLLTADQPNSEEQTPVAAEDVGSFDDGDDNSFDTFGTEEPLEDNFGSTDGEETENFFGDDSADLAVEEKEGAGEATEYDSWGGDDTPGLDDDNLAPLDESELDSDNQIAAPVVPEETDLPAEEDLASSPIGGSEVEPAPAWSGKSPEQLDDVKQFGQSIKIGSQEQAGNPPFSIVLRNIKYKEDRDIIYSMLVEYGLVSPKSDKDIQLGLDNGALLISHISEYLAVFLAHKFRQFDMEIYVGQSEELHPSKVYRDDGGKGLVDKSNIEQNRKDAHQSKT